MTKPELDTRLLEEFARKHRLTTKRDSDESLIITGRNGNIFQFDEEKLGVVVQPGANNPRAWNTARRAFERAGMTITQDGDCEGVATFDPKSSEQAKLAMQYANVKPKKVAMPAQLAAIAGYRASKGSKGGLIVSRHAQIPSRG